MKRLIKRSFLDTLPVMAGYMVLGFGFGLISAEKGYGVFWAVAMSAFIYAGSMQYVALDLLSGGATLITAAITTLMVNARHLFYGITMIEHYKGMGKRKPYLIFSLTDETYSLLCSGKAPDGLSFRGYALTVSVFNQCYWVLGSLLGALVGSASAFNTKGVDFAMTALFITVFVEQWKCTKKHLPAIVGVAASVICLLIFGAKDFLIPSMILITLCLSLGKKLIDKEEA
ncbi:MAG: AzlC family ABC transporter permease [Clostridia bacterium]|nr:AzlC family ABC transporter permease [Clostridia bacterium]